VQYSGLLIRYSTHLPFHWREVESIIVTAKAPLLSKPAGKFSHVKY